MTKIETVTVSSLGTLRFEVYSQSTSPRGKTQWNFQGAYWSMADALKAEKKLLKKLGK